MSPVHFFLAAGTPVSSDGEGSIAGLIIYILIALGFSFLCSVWEAVMLSTSISYIEMMVEQKRRSAIVMKNLKENLDQAISAILTLNTIAHTVGAAGAGAQAAAVFGSEWIGIISAILTFLILVFSEIIPKTIGAVYWKQLMPFTAYGVRALVIILYPAVWAFQILGRLIAPRGEKAPTITRSELEILVNIGRKEGALKEKENLILKNLFQLNKVQVQDIMTPRPVVFMLKEDVTLAEVQEKHNILNYGRIPIFKDDADDVTGFVLRHKILTAMAQDRYDLTLKQICRPIHSVPESLSVDKVLEEFTSRQEHIFLVFDEFGGTAGIVTLEDALESLIGVEITDESDLVADMRELAKQRYERRFALPELDSDNASPSANTSVSDT